MAGSLRRWLGLVLAVGRPVFGWKLSSWPWEEVTVGEEGAHSGPELLELLVPGACCPAQDSMFSVRMFPF